MWKGEENRGTAVLEINIQSKGKGENQINYKMITKALKISVKLKKRESTSWGDILLFIMFVGTGQALHVPS